MGKRLTDEKNPLNMVEAVKTGDIVTADTHMYQRADYPYALADFGRRFVRVADVNIGAFSVVWGNNPDTDMAFWK